MKALSTFFRLRRRYTRSVNLERDLAIADSLQGYLPTPRSLEVVERVAAALARPQSVARAWTVTGVYGTGKSAFAHFLAALHGPSADQARTIALEILAGEGSAGRKLAEHLAAAIPDSGFVRAVVTARREPLTHTVIRGLARGAEAFWASRAGRKPTVLATLADLQKGIASGHSPDADRIPDLVRELADASGAGVLLLVDELGKVLEHAAGSDGSADLYLLQQLAELPVRAGAPPVLVLGLLHQAFSEYGHGLGSVQRSEWDKVQGRFEDVVFAEAPEQMLRLVAQAIEAKRPRLLTQALAWTADYWDRYFRSALEHPYIAEVLTPQRTASLYPLHPVSALALPVLCAKYAQNDRSLFTFLTSEETHSFARFLAEQQIDLEADPPQLPLLRLPELYDYFIAVGGVGISARAQFQRWAEVHGLIQDAVGLSADETAALKAIGTLNLLTSTGPLRASRPLVVASLVERPGDEADFRRWSEVLDRLVEKRFVTHRRQIDELRIWEGSDFDVEDAVRTRIEADRRPLSAVLSRHAPLPPVVAERHSYRTGTLRYFERCFVDGADQLAALHCGPGSDGVIAYWATEEPPAAVPARSADGRPLVLVRARRITALRSAAAELAALSDLDRTEPVLQTDGVARREVRHRLVVADRVLADALRLAFDLRDETVTDPAAGGGAPPRCWVGGKPWTDRNLNAALSTLCDDVYNEGPVLWNELINRRELTPQGSRARRELIEALVDKPGRPQLGLTGFGPDVSMYASVLLNTGIHRPDESGAWTVGPPTRGGLGGVWAAIERFFAAASGEPRTLDHLYGLLQQPPYGAREGLIPVLIAAALVCHAEDVTLYRDGSFLPVLGPEQFEVLVKHPARFAVKHLALSGIRFEVFRQLESVIVGGSARLPSKIRNASLLGVVRPLVRFAAALPAVTKKSTALSAEATAVRDALLVAREPDILVFEALPESVGLPPFRPGEVSPVPSRQLAAFRRALLRALTELQTHYDQMLASCRSRLHDAFGVSAEEVDVRQHLRVRAQYLLGRIIEPRLKRFTLAAADFDADDRQWIEAIAMIVADRPMDSWTEDDVLAFEANLGDLARRFASLEALQRGAAAAGRDGFDARRVTITRPDGHEVHQLVWLDRAEAEFVESRVRRIMRELKGMGHEYQARAVAVALVERLLAGDAVLQTSIASQQDVPDQEVGNG